MAARWPRRQRARLNLAGRPPASHPLIRPAGFAPGLIAAKPGKPCDRAIFGAFCPLLKKEWKRADTPAPPFTGPRLRAHGQPSIGPLPGFHGPDAVADLGAAARRPKDRKLQGKSLCRCLSASFPRPSFAPGLIAAKPEKPCDGAVFGAFYLLLKKERKRADTPALPFTGPRLRAHGQPSIGPLPGFHGPAALADFGAAALRRGGQKTASFKASRQSLCRCLSAFFPRPSFAPGLRAAKPEKPCDGGVFGAFYLLLKKERNAASRALVWLRMGLLRFKRGIAWALQAGASFGQPTGPSRPTRRNQAPPQARPRPAFAAARTPQAFAGFATALIATKPEKTCDRAVFLGFYLLLKKERAGRFFSFCAWRCALARSAAAGRRQ